MYGATRNPMPSSTYYKKRSNSDAEEPTKLGIISSPVIRPAKKPDVMPPALLLPDSCEISIEKELEMAPNSFPKYGVKKSIFEETDENFDFVLDILEDRNPNPPMSKFQESFNRLVPRINGRGDDHESKKSKLNNSNNNIIIAESVKEERPKNYERLNLEPSKREPRERRIANSILEYLENN